jgi:hypothetical protein
MSLQAITPQMVKAKFLRGLYNPDIRLGNIIAE